MFGVLVGGHVGGVIGLILLVRVAAAAQAELAARVLPCLPCAVPVKPKLCQCLPDGGRGLFTERNPNPFSNHLGKLPQTAVLLLEQGQNFFSRQCAVGLPCLGINRQSRILLRCCGLCWLCRNTISGVDREPFNQFGIFSFHNLFFTELTRVCCLSPFTKSGAPVLPEGRNLRREPEAGGLVFLGEAVRARGKGRQGQEKGFENGAGRRPLAIACEQKTTAFMSGAIKSI